MLWATGMEVTSTRDVTGRQLPLVTVPAWELRAAEQDWCWDLNPGVAAIPSGGTRSFVGVDTSGLGRESGPVTLGRHTA